MDDSGSRTHENGIVLRSPVAEDAAAVWSLIRRCKPLDENSSYAYLLLCTHFADTCVVAERDGDVIGFVSGYRKPAAPDTIFIWQVAVSDTARGMGLGRRMVQRILAATGAQYMETTVTPSNAASRRMFAGVAEGLSIGLRESSCFSSGQFGENNHEEERLLTVGPMKGEL